MHQASQALRQLGQGRHTGKIALTLPARLDPQGTVLVTGANGHLGRHVTRHLAVNHGVRNFLLVSRHCPDAHTAAELDALGANVMFAACDVADQRAFAELLATVPDDCPITAVIHAAGVLHDATIPNLTADHVTDALRPKVDAAWNLHEMIGNLTAFVLFSSVAGTLGSPGQGNYAAANAFLDGLAHHRHMQGQPAISIAWGPWTNHSETDLRPLSTEHALTLLDAALASPYPTVVSAHLDTVSKTAVDRLQLTDLPEAEQHAVLLDAIRGSAAAVLGLSTADHIDNTRPFTQLGLDSLGAIELRNTLAGMTGLQLPATLVFDHPNPNALARHLRDRIAPAAAVDDFESATDEELFAALDTEFGRRTSR
jgi:NAD(P)-dependent dehydrogenase (short-subunit alcohol dehydrogenase family)/acyl carrier protein